MNDEQENIYWKSPAQRDGQPLPAPPQEELGPTHIGRRRFLEAAGFTVSAVALSGCDDMRARVETASPLRDNPEGLVPGRSRQYASTCAGCDAACGLLIGVRDGRPLKMEGLPEHPLSQGGLCAVGQALPLGLYDSKRLEQPLIAGKHANWSDVDQNIAAKLQEIQNSGGEVRFVTNTITSPTLQQSINEFLKPHKNAKHIVFDAISHSAILDAHEKTHGERVLPHYQIERADVIVSFGADFLGTWISPVEFTKAWSKRRVPSADHPDMSHHVQFESRMTLSGSKADQRIVIEPGDEGLILSHLASKVAKLAKQTPPNASLEDSPVADDMLSAIADRLWHAKGKSAILSGSQDVEVQVIVNYLNHLLASEGSTINLRQPSFQAQGNDRDVAQLIDEITAGKVAALFVAGTDLTHNLPNREKLAAAMGDIPLVVSFADREDDFSQLATHVCPDHHGLESWSDAEPVSGTVSLCQPALRPLTGSRSILESLAVWSDKPASALEIVKKSWRERIYSRAKNAAEFDRFWNSTLRQGFASVAPRTTDVGSFKIDAVKLIEKSPEQSGFSLILHPSVGIRETRHAQNPWLQELPDPISKITWDNYLSISAKLAEKQSLESGDVVRISVDEGGVDEDSASVELPVFIQPGQNENTVAAALGYGVKGTERFADVGPQWFDARTTVGANGLVGTNVAPLLALDKNSIGYTRSNVRITKTGRHHELASTQEHDSIDVPAHLAPPGARRRPIIEETTLGEYQKDQHAGDLAHHHGQDADLWPADHPKPDHNWAMTIDLNTCSGCSACVIACQSENNVPVVGRDEVRRQREMHWIRIDRYYSGEDEEVDVSHQPMMCQHCDNAPCETVCPVLATVHSEEGLNQQVYNRCVGTRYCANNCPYKVRRFNWFNYPFDDSLANLALNPDVTVRTRGVMEKCSMCVQRIQEAKSEASHTGVLIGDQTIQTACQQSCPANAIVFGDLNDPESKVSEAMHDPRRYRVLEEINVQPSVGYLRIVRNRDGENHEHE
jgi:Fe-S-cluster-containing dehydrogenase component/anaerobic selenocysteine-containing dehydrogenase